MTRRHKGLYRSRPNMAYFSSTMVAKLQILTTFPLFQVSNCLFSPSLICSQVLLLPIQCTSARDMNFMTKFIFLFILLCSLFYFIITFLVELLISFRIVCIILLDFFLHFIPHIEFIVLSFGIKFRVDLRG